MPVSLKKNSVISLSKVAPGLQSAVLSLGWEKSPMDLDIQCFILGSNDKVLSDEHFIFYNNKNSPCGNIRHSGDSRNGAAEGDDERITINLASLSSEIKKIAVTVSIHEAESRGHSFGLLKNAYAKLLNAKDESLLVYDLDEDTPNATCMIFCELYRQPDSEWNFKAVGTEIQGGLEGACIHYGVNI
jgi:tellurium resistance protein TerD